MFYVDISANVEQQDPDKETLASSSARDVNAVITMSDPQTSPNNSPRSKERLHHSTAEDAEDNNESLFPRCKSSKYTLREHASFRLNYK